MPSVVEIWRVGLDQDDTVSQEETATGVLDTVAVDDPGLPVFTQVCPDFQSSDAKTERVLSDSTGYASGMGIESRDSRVCRGRVCTE